MKRRSTSLGRAAATLVVLTFATATTQMAISKPTTSAASVRKVNSLVPAVAPPKGLITAGPSRNECLEPNFDDTGVNALNAAVTRFDSVTGTTVTCVSAYLNGAPTWTQWENPWVAQSQYGYNLWVAEAPNSRQLILAVSLIPDSLEDINDPLHWEQSCAAGDFNSYATELGTNLVAAGLQNSVIRLGEEMNGIWEEDYVGTTTTEQNLWATCFANEVTALRQAPEEHFLIDWNPNACKGAIPYGNYYPGDQYVDIVGLDLFDDGCNAPYSKLSFTQLARESYGLSSFEAFAAARRKPMSLPEWGLFKEPSGDDPGYINGIAATFYSRDFSFEAYFDANLEIRPYLPLGAQTPRSLAAFKKWFKTKK